MISLPELLEVARARALPGREAAAQNEVLRLHFAALATCPDRPRAMIRVIIMHSSAGHTVMSNISEEFRQEPEDPLDRWRREKAEREEPQPRERRLDTALPTLDDIDRRIEERVAAEHKFMMDILAELLAHIQSDAEMRGRRGRRAAGRTRTARQAAARQAVDTRDGTL